MVLTMKTLLLALGALSLAACSLNPSVDTLSSEQRAKVASMRVHENNPWPQARLIAKVSGLSCNRNKYQEPEVNSDEALQGIKIRAALAGGDGVVNTLCQKNALTDYVHSCWTSVRCVGDAVKL